MNLSARSNNLGNIINALEMILNHQRAVHFIWQCCQGKTWSIPSLAVCGKRVILWPIWCGCTYAILYDFQEMLFWVHTFKNCDKNWASSGLFRSYSAKYKQQSQLRKIENTTKRYVLTKKFLTLSLCWIFSFVDTCRYYWKHISRSFCWTEMIKLSLLVIVRKRNINLSLEEYVVLCKSSGNHQKVMLRTLTLAKTKDIHQPRQPGWDALGFIYKKKKHTFTGPQAHCQKKISGSGSFNRKPKSSMNSALI